MVVLKRDKTILTTKDFNLLLNVPLTLCQNVTPVVLDETVGHKTSRIESDLGRYRDTHTEQLRSLSKFQNNSDHITQISWISCLGRVISSEEKLFYLQLFLKFDFLQITQFVSLRNNYNKIGGYVFLWIKYPP